MKRIAGRRRPAYEPQVESDRRCAANALCTITATLIWNGNVQTGQTHSTSGFSPGDQLILAQQVSGDVTTTNR